VDLALGNKVALVAAASKGLGRAIAEAFAAEGASLIICARGRDELQAAKESIERGTKAKVHAIAADVSDAEQLAHLSREALAKWGRIDVLVTNSGGPPSGPATTHDWQRWDEAVKLLLRSTVELTRAVLPGMRQRKWGRIINVTSIAVKQPVDNLILSNSIRSAVTGFARTLANEVATDGITVNNILPGYTRTERVEQLAAATAAREGTSQQDVVARFEAQIPMRRLGEPKEFAALAAFLASEQASYITGQSIAVDGGWIKGLL
jgi:3-oxoacyl-[acyl-carrier protein] reductase